MKPRGSDSRPGLGSDGLSRHFSGDYPPVAGIFLWMLCNTDNIMWFLFWIFGPNGTRIIFPSLSSAHLPGRAPVPPYAALPGRAAAEPLTVYLCESQQIAICLCWFITPFHHLSNHHEVQNSTALSFLPSSPIPFVLTSSLWSNVRIS